MENNMEKLKLLYYIWNIIGKNRFKYRLFGVLYFFLYEL